MRVGPPWLALCYSQAAFKAHTQVVALVLKLASEVVEEHVSYLKVCACRVCSSTKRTQRLVHGSHDRDCGRPGCTCLPAARVVVSACVCACTQPPEVEALMRWVLALLQQYASINTWAVRLTASRAQQVRGGVDARRG